MRSRSAAGPQGGAILSDRSRHRLHVDVAGELVEIDAAEHLTAGHAGVFVATKTETSIRPPLQNQTSRVRSG
jgi:hypothetical protein